MKILFWGILLYLTYKLVMPSRRLSKAADPEIERKDDDGFTEYEELDE